MNDPATVWTLLGSGGSPDRGQGSTASAPAGGGRQAEASGPAVRDVSAHSNVCVPVKEEAGREDGPDGPMRSPTPRGVAPRGVARLRFHPVKPERFYG